MLEIIGTMKSKDTQKAIRYFKERRVPFQFVDLAKAELGEKVWRSIFSSQPDAAMLIDKESKAYRDGGYEWMEYDPKELLIEHPELLIQPVLRERDKARSGWSEQNAEAFL